MHLIKTVHDQDQDQDALDKDSCRITVGGSGPGLALADSGWVERGEGGACVSSTLYSASYPGCYFIHFILCYFIICYFILCFY